MAKYTTTKVLKKATPTVRNDNQVVKTWDIEVLYTHSRVDGTTWGRSYSHTEEVEFLNKTATEFTKAELIGFMNSNMDVIFDAHYDAHNTPPTDEKVSDFNLNTLS